jgi:hypothetical protein
MIAPWVSVMRLGNLQWDAASGYRFRCRLPVFVALAILGLGEFAIENPSSVVFFNHSMTRSLNGSNCCSLFPVS